MIETRNARTHDHTRTHTHSQKHLLDHKVDDGGWAAVTIGSCKDCSVLLQGFEAAQTASVSEREFEAGHSGVRGKVTEDETWWQQHRLTLRARAGVNGRVWRKSIESQQVGLHHRWTRIWLHKRSNQFKEMSHTNIKPCDLRQVPEAQLRILVRHVGAHGAKGNRVARAESGHRLAFAFPFALLTVRRSHRLSAEMDPFTCLDACEGPGAGKQNHD
jgi:hypothetical protein